MTAINRHRTTNIIGTADVDTGHVLRESRKSKLLKQNIFTNGDAYATDNTQNLLLRLTFEQSSDKKMLNRKMRDCLEQDAKIYEENLIKRRDKLRKLLASEDFNFTKELVDKNNKLLALKKLEMENKTETDKKLENENHQLEVAAKRMQQYLARYPEVRTTFTKKSTADVKQCNLAQIKENTVKKQSEKQLEELWHKMALEKLEQNKKQDEQTLKLKEQLKFNVANDLKKQIQEKLAMQAEEMRVKEEERKQLEKLMENIKHESLSEMQRKQEERKRLKTELETQLEIARKRIAEHAIEESALDKTFASLDEDVQNEKMKLKMSSKALHKELTAYMQSLKEFREQQAKRDAELDIMICKVASEAEDKRRQVKIQEQEARKRELKEVLEIRAKQLEEKQKQKEYEKQQRIIEDKLLEEQRKSEENLMMEKCKSKRINALRYGQELKAQKEYLEHVKQREQDEIELMYKRDLEKEQKYKTMIQKLLESPQLSTPQGCTTQADELLKRVDSKILKTNLVS